MQAISPRRNQPENETVHPRSRRFWCGNLLERSRPGFCCNMRLTRMLRSLTLLGQPALAKSFHRVLVGAAKTHPKIFSKRTLDFWAEAVNLPSEI